jgi:hypothetical protein
MCVASLRSSSINCNYMLPINDQHIKRKKLSFQILPLLQSVPLDRYKLKHSIGRFAAERRAFACMLVGARLLCPLQALALWRALLMCLDLCCISLTCVASPHWCHITLACVRCCLHA